MRAARVILLLCVAAAGVASPGCGKKGAPLAPFARVPGRPMDVTVRRTGGAVAITFTVPSANIDDTKPADIGRVEVYAYTALAQNDVRDTRRMTLVATVPVRKPPEPEEEQPAKPDAKTPAKAPPKKAPRPPEPGEDQGAVVTVTEVLTPEMQVPQAPDTKPAARREPAVPEPWFDAPSGPPLAGPPPQPEARRYYVLYGISRGGNRGAASLRPAVPLTPPPPAPARPGLETTERGVVVTWETPPGARLPFQEPAESGTLSATFKGMESAPPLSYVVYLATPGQPAPAGAAAPSTTMKLPKKLTEKPVRDRSWTDGESEFGVERCYDVRTVSVQGSATIESAPSPIACITPADTFPPPAPSALAAVAGEGVISLIWEGVDAPDLAGYVVLRGVAPGGALAPLFEAPLRETTYRDTTAKAGVRYIYAVVAVDRATPPNRSAPSNKVEETAR